MSASAIRHLKSFFPFLPIRHIFRKQFEISIIMRMDFQVTKLMQNNIIYAIHGCLNEGGIQEDVAGFAAAPPPF